MCAVHVVAVATSPMMTKHIFSIRNKRAFARCANPFLFGYVYRIALNEFVSCLDSIIIIIRRQFLPINKFIFISQIFHLVPLSVVIIAFASGIWNLENWRRRWCYHECTTEKSLFIYRVVIWNRMESIQCYCSRHCWLLLLLTVNKRLLSLCRMLCCEIVTVTSIRTICIWLLFAGIEIEILFWLRFICLYNIWVYVCCAVANWPIFIFNKKW